MQSHKHNRGGWGCVCVCGEGIWLPAREGLFSSAGTGNLSSGEQLECFALVMSAWCKIRATGCVLLLRAGAQLIQNS